jgi:xanthine dehydrogenase accessory factor
MVCGGSVRVLVEIVAPPLPLLIFGAGHVGRELAHLAGRIGFAVTVIDDRPGEIEPGRLPDGVGIVRAAPDFASGLPAVPEGAFVAIVTRCHRTDLAALRHAAGRGAAYLGLIGSRRKVATVVERAVEAGTPREALAGLRAPIGLPIGAETPEEIAICIAAEMIAVRRGAAAADALRGVTPLPRGRARGRTA